MPQAIFAGQLAGDDLARAYASSDMLFNPSTTETFGNVTLEAMACGLPVVGARATGTSSLVHHGISGQLVTPGDIPGYAAALATYLTGRPRRGDGRRGGTRAQPPLFVGRDQPDDARSLYGRRRRAGAGAGSRPWVPLYDRVVTALRAA